MSTYSTLAFETQTFNWNPNPDTTGDVGFKPTHQLCKELTQAMVAWTVFEHNLNLLRVKWHSDTIRLWLQNTTMFFHGLNQWTVDLHKGSCDSQTIRFITERPVVVRKLDCGSKPRCHVMTESTGGFNVIHGSGVLFRPALGFVCPASQEGLTETPDRAVIIGNNCHCTFPDATVQCAVKRLYFGLDYGFLCQQPTRL